MCSCSVHSFLGMCDASGGIAVDDNLFLAINDEDNILRIYDKSEQSPLILFDTSPYLRLNYREASTEVDFEAVTRIGDIIYFISSHGRDKNGGLRKNRHRFFACQIQKNGGWQLSFLGQPYTNLMDDLVNDQNLKRLDLPSSYMPQTSRKKFLAPKYKGVNIEGLAATSDGSALFIGFRNPIPGKKALLVPLLNPNDLLMNKPPIFGAPILLNLGGLGIRSIEYSPYFSCYFIIAGPHDGKPEFNFYQWSGDISQDPQKIDLINMKQFDFLNPEALFFYDKKSEFQILSDDGLKTIKLGNNKKCDCKKAPDDNLKSFQSIIINSPMGEQGYR